MSVYSPVSDIWRTVHTLAFSTPYSCTCPVRMLLDALDFSLSVCIANIGLFTECWALKGKDDRQHWEKESAFPKVGELFC